MYSTALHYHPYHPSCRFPILFSFSIVLSNCLAQIFLNFDFFSESDILTCCSVMTQGLAVVLNRLRCIFSGRSTVLSCVMCHVSPVTCHLSPSPVTCHLSHVIIFFFFTFKFYIKKNTLPKILDKVVELVGGGSVINGAYPI